MTEFLRGVVTRHATSEVTSDAVLEDIVPCEIALTYSLHLDVEEAFNLTIPDRVAASWRTVADIERTIQEMHNDR